MSNEKVETEKSEIEKKLDELQKRLIQEQNDAGKQTIRLDSVKAGVADLAKTDSEVKQIKDTYEKAYDNFYKDLDELNCYFKQKETSVDQRPEMGNVKQLIKDLKNIRDPIEESFNEKNKKYTNAKKAFEDCKNIQNIAEKQNNFDSLKKYQKEAEEKLKNLKSLKSIIEKEQQKGKFENVCFWVTEFDNEKFDLKDKDAFNKELVDSWKNLFQAKSDYRDKEQEMKIAKIDLDTAQNQLNELDSLIKDHSDDIFSKISEIIKNNPPTSYNPPKPDNPPKPNNPSKPDTLPND